MNLPQPLTKGERIAFFDLQPNESWLVVYTSECGATVERELKSPRKVEIKDADGNVTRSFFARTSGDRQQISLRSHVVRLGRGDDRAEQPEEFENASAFLPSEDEEIHDRRFE